MICGCGIGSDRIEVCAFPPIAKNAMDGAPTVSLRLGESVWAGLRFVLSHPLCVAEIERIGLQRIDVCAFSTPFLPVKKKIKKRVFLQRSCFVSAGCEEVFLLNS